MTAPESKAEPEGPDTAESRDAVPQRGLVSRAAAAWPAMTGTAAAASVTLALLVLVCTFVAVAVPRASLGYRTAVLQRAFHAASRCVAEGRAGRRRPVRARRARR